MSNFAKPSDRRQFGRRQTFKHGWIKMQGRPPVTCIVRNVSEGGALLELPANTWLPFQFRIEIEGEGIATDCEVRHQRDNMVGVCFAQRATDTTTNARVSLDDVGSWGGVQAARTIRR